MNFQYGIQGLKLEATGVNAVFASPGCSQSFSCPDSNLQNAQHDYQARVFTLQRLRTQLSEAEQEKNLRASELEKLTTQLNVRRVSVATHVVQLQRGLHWTLAGNCAVTENWITSGPRRSNVNSALLACVVLSESLSSWMCDPPPRENPTFNDFAGFSSISRFFHLHSLAVFFFIVPRTCCFWGPSTLPCARFCQEPLSTASNWMIRSG